jgi:hypothetical protein
LTGLLLLLARLLRAAALLARLALAALLLLGKRSSGPVSTAGL